MISDAILSACGRYRYLLSRRWGDGPELGVVMLNPSTANASQDDPTIRRLYGFAEAHTTYGVIGIKVWVYKGEIFDISQVGQEKQDDSPRSDRGDRGDRADRPRGPRREREARE